MSMKEPYMEKRQTSSITQFDTLYTSNHIQILKILMPFFTPPMQKQIAVYIKYQELQTALNKTKQNQTAPFSQIPFASNMEPLCDEISNFLDPQELQSLSQIKSTIKSFHDMQETMEMFQMMQETMSEEEMGEFMKGQFHFF